MKSTYEQILENATDTVKNYRSDLEIDKEWIESHPETLFIHCSRESGTHLIELYSSEGYPSQGVKVPYYFRTADRWYILDNVANILDASIGQDIKVYQYFDGKTVKVINEPKARSIVSEYIRNMKNQWHRELKRVA